MADCVTSGNVLQSLQARRVVWHAITLSTPHRWRVTKYQPGLIQILGWLQVEGAPAKLENHGNAFLHYSDDWYILGSKPDQYVLIYYVGNNDAWSGYGGATVYTK